MKKLHIIILTLGIIFLNTACNKNNVCPTCLGCKSLPEIEGFSVGYSISEGEHQYKSPCFNPNNSNQFVFIFKDNPNRTTQLCTYDMSTQEKKVLTESDHFILQPKWSSRDWIAFNVGHQIWRIKSNGDSLVAVTESESSLYPVWSADGKQLLFEQSKNAGVPYNIIRYNLATLQADTFKDQTFELASCSKGNSLVIVNSANFKKSSVDKMDKWELIGDDTFNGGNRIKGVDWGKDESTIFITRLSKGLLRYNLSNSNEKQLKCACDTRRFGFVSVSPDGDKLIFEQYDSFLKDKELDIIEENCSIHIIDVSGRHDKKIEIPN